jgi:hypothetical protein
MAPGGIIAVAVAVDGRINELRQLLYTQRALERENRKHNDQKPVVCLQNTKNQTTTKATM